MISGTYHGLSAEFATVLKGYCQAVQKPMSEILVDQASKLSCSDFGNGRVGLFQEAAKLAPTAEELFALPLKLNWRIKRRGRPVLTVYTKTTYTRGKKKGQTREVRAKNASGEKIKAGEIQRRLAARLYQATGWLNEVLSKEIKSGRLRKQASAFVNFRLTGDVIVIEITNPRKGAAEVNAKAGDYIARALKSRELDMLEYISRHLDRVKVEFQQAPLTRAA